jgi:hypothetical protein
MDMAGGRRRFVTSFERRIRFGLLAICIASTGCEQSKRTALSYSTPSGTIDPKADPMWGMQYPDMPPQPGGRQFDPTDGMGIQKFADHLIGRHVAIFVVHNWDQLRSGTEINSFFPAAEAGPGPGMCKARRFQIAAGYLGSATKVAKVADGEWLDQACKQRTDMDMWYQVDPHYAYLAAQLADAVVASARHKGSLPFGLHCTLYPRGKSRCQEDVRRSVASINPRAILEVHGCEEPKGSRCFAIQFAKSPARIAKIEDRWTLEITFIPGRDLQIHAVDVEDTQLNID